MRILFLSKRRYMGKDVIVDRYARMYEFPFQLARRDHAVLACCLSYGGAAEGHWTHDASPGTLEWGSWNLGRTVLPGLLRFSREALSKARTFQPDVVIGASDIPHCVLARHFALRLGVPYAIDLYDNFESYGQARLPGARLAFRAALRGAALVSCVSEPLTDWVRALGAKGTLITLHSTVDKATFRPRNQLESRALLGLPTNARLVGTAGSLHHDKGIATLYAAYAQLSQADANLHLVLAGPMDAKFPTPKGIRVHYLGLLPHDQIPTLFAALDVGVICIRDTLFGRYCFPQKAYEMIACGIPVVAADVGAMPATLASFPRSLYRRDDAASLATQIASQLAQPEPPQLDIPDWAELAARLEKSLPIPTGKGSIATHRSASE